MELPSTNDDLATNYSAQDILDVAEIDGTYVCQDATNTYVVHQFKNFAGEANSVTLNCRAKSGLAPTSSTVYLQVYNHTSGEWDTKDSNNLADSDTDFDLTASIPDLTNYKDGSQIITCRVYQVNQ